MTLEVNGTLKGSEDPRQYTVNYHNSLNEQNLVMSRYEGMELLCFRSLINVGCLDSDDRKRVTCHNVKITGNGSIIGGGQALGDQMELPFADSTKYPEYLSDGIPGRRVRGRLISVIQTKSFSISGVTLKQPSSWTVHILYSRNVTIHNIRIDSRGVDPDSSQNIYIFHCQIDSLFMHSVNYNSDGERADQLPVFKNIFVRDCEILGNTHDVDNLGNSLTSKGKSVEIIGFKDQRRISKIQNIYLKNIILKAPTDLFYLEMCDRVILENVQGKNNDCQLKIGAHVQHLEINNERISNDE